MARREVVRAKQVEREGWPQARSYAVVNGTWCAGQNIRDAYKTC